MPTSGAEDKLTVILTLKGRADYNARWIKYHQAIGLKYKLLIGDGEPSEETEALFKASGLNCEYIRYDDVNITAYYRKIVDLTARVNTPFVVYTDNDDFIVSDGPERCVEFLLAHPDYVSCGGRVLGLAIGNRSLNSASNPIYGTWHSARCLYNYPPRRKEPLAADRVVQTLLDYNVMWYGVHRKDALLSAATSLVQPGISDIQLMELIVTAMLAAQGKQHTESGFFNYARQLATSSTSHLYSDSIFERILTTNLVQDCHTMAKVVSEQIAKSDSIESGRIESQVIKAIAGYFNSRATEPQISTRIQSFFRRYFHTARAKIPGVHSATQQIEIALLSQPLDSQGRASLKRTFSNINIAIQETSFAP